MIFLCLFRVFFAPASYCMTAAEDPWDQEWIKGCDNSYATHKIEVAAADYWEAEQELYASVGCRWIGECKRTPEKLRMEFLGSSFSGVGYSVEGIRWDEEDYDDAMDWLAWDSILESFEPPTCKPYEANVRWLNCTGRYPYGSVECEVYETEAYGRWNPVCL